MRTCICVWVYVCCCNIYETRRAIARRKVRDSRSLLKRLFGNDTRTISLRPRSFNAQLPRGETFIFTEKERRRRWRKNPARYCSSIVEVGKFQARRKCSPLLTIKRWSTYRSFVNHDCNWWKSTKGRKCEEQGRAASLIKKRTGNIFIEFFVPSFWQISSNNGEKGKLSSRKNSLRNTLLCNVKRKYGPRFDNTGRNCTSWSNATCNSPRRKIEDNATRWLK